VSRPVWQREGADWPNREHSLFVTANGIEWHVQVAGTGPPLLLLHGTGAATHSWRDLLPLLAGHFRIVAPDLPGHGFTAMPRSGELSLPRVTADIIALLGALEVSPTIVVGHSAGAAIGIALSGAAQSVAQIVSINGALLPFPGLAGLFFPAMARLFFANPLAPYLFSARAGLPGEVARFLERGTGSRIDRKGVELYARLFATSAHCAGALSMMAHWDLDAFARTLDAVRIPLMLIHGDGDVAVPPSVAAKVSQRVPSATVHRLSGVGHLAHEEVPEQIANLLIGIKAAGAIEPGKDGK
jgi:magnesium chelatase accessory protein